MEADAGEAESSTLYLVSDLHIGGDEQLGRVDFESELLDFLATLEGTDEDAELIVNGDAFGLWEFTQQDGIEKFDTLVEDYPDLFEGFRATGETVPITLIPGNHDYELAAYDEYVDRLAEYNVTLEQAEVITREVGGRLVWIEHGMQRDPNNRIPDFGNPYANPLGYFVNRHVTSKAGTLSDRGRYNWLKDIQAVTPMELIPEWLVSNYFYREMSPLLRYAVLPFLLLFEVSAFYLALVLMDVTGVWSAPVEFVHGILFSLGVVGDVVDAVVVANLVVIVLLSIVAVPLYLFVRDVRKTVQRFGIVDPRVTRHLSDPYLAGAREVFESRPEVAVFVYGHTHRASLTHVDDRVVVNTGTWLKRLHRKSVRFGPLPPVFYPSYRLNYFKVEDAGEEGDVAVEYHVVEKPNPKELTLLERLLTRRPKLEESIPERTIVGSGGE